MYQIDYGDGYREAARDEVSRLIKDHHRRTTIYGTNGTLFILAHDRTGEEIRLVTEAD
jgi:hypothetical protein